MGMTPDEHYLNRREKMTEEKLVNEKQSSIALKRSTKGVYSWDLKLYYDDSNTAYSDVIVKLKAIDTKLKEDFE